MAGVLGNHVLIAELVEDLRDRCLIRGANEEMGNGSADMPTATSPMAAGRQQVYEWVAEQLNDILEAREQPEVAEHPTPVEVPEIQRFSVAATRFLAAAGYEADPNELLAFICGWTEYERIRRPIGGPQEGQGAADSRAETETSSVKERIPE